ncbi:hypothetical protein OLZ32_07435 [Rhizobium sp. 1AS11]|uniref:hypothetical protein n=1 Tax=Rhizobium acaciae TaxID=2989736 RepID=UPI001FDA17A8|nr:hypothetical protein [Rhizobium acaciae]MCW1408092.1 hypothetical protein [Rhizobium acaciae]MCW1740243.1 hypothetical protein [Rhizobium acaciae]
MTAISPWEISGISSPAWLPPSPRLWAKALPATTQKNATAENAVNSSGLALSFFIIARKVQGAGKAARFDAFSEMPLPAGRAARP